MTVFPHALLIGNGPDVSPRLVQELARQADFIVAADAGADTARRAGIVPDVIIGDLDSVSAAARKRFASSRWIFVDNQNNTDLQKALDFLTAQKCKHCTLVGFIGGRVDFSVGNILALYPYAKKMQLCLAADSWEIYPIFSRRTFLTRPGKRVSLLPLTSCQGVTLSGLKYPLANARLTFGTTRTLSNQTTGKRFSVRVKSGFLLVYVEK